MSLEPCGLCLPAGEFFIRFCGLHFFFTREKRKLSQEEKMKLKDL